MFEKTTQIDANYAPAWAYLGASNNSDAAFELGGREQYRRAQAAYERALALRPNLLDAQVFLANLLIDTGKVEQAVPLLRDGLKTNSIESFKPVSQLNDCPARAIGSNVAIVDGLHVPRLNGRVREMLAGGNTTSKSKPTRSQPKRLIQHPSVRSR